MLSNEQLKLLRSSASKGTNKIEQIFLTQRIPENGFDDATLEQFILAVARTDSNNQSANVGAGEREGRIVCPLVGRLHYGMVHGIGRSGNIAEAQPKALGSSFVNCLANKFAVEALNVLDIKSVKHALVLPVCTGMAITLSLLALKARRPNATHVLWCRVDQKSCFKAVQAAGLTPIVVQLLPSSEQSGKLPELSTSLVSLNEAIADFDPESILCVISTTSCFAPRLPDDIGIVGKFAKHHGLLHVVNNAYGLICEGIRGRLNAAFHLDLVDLFVQSTDKNFLTPVGGSVVAASKEMVQSVAKLYPGRASAVPSRDFVLTLLHLGKNGLKSLMTEREVVYQRLVESMRILAAELNEFLMESTSNGISMAMTLKHIDPRQQKSLGGSLFSKHKVTGARVVASTSDETVINGVRFVNFNSHNDQPHCGYLTVAAGAGMTETEVEHVVQRIRECYLRFRDK